MLLALLLVHLRREPDANDEIRAETQVGVEFHSNGTPKVSNKTARPRKLPLPLLLVGWVVSLLGLYYCAYGTYYAIPDAETPHKCPWGGDWTPPLYEKPDGPKGGCAEYMYETSGCWGPPPPPSLTSTSGFKCGDTASDVDAQRPACSTVKDHSDTVMEMSVTFKRGRYGGGTTADITVAFNSTDTGANVTTCPGEPVAVNNSMISFPTLSKQSSCLAKLLLRLGASAPITVASLQGVYDHKTDTLTLSGLNHAVVARLFGPPILPAASATDVCKHCVTTLIDDPDFSASCTVSNAQAWCAEFNEPDISDDYGTRSHSFHDMFFSVTFRMWCHPWAVMVMSTSLYRLKFTHVLRYSY
jgi:hypothetical protein|eukprot:COSAG01_NODE_529_length_15890_cov_548.099994_17_plen_357_part_00